MSTSAVSEKSGAAMARRRSATETPIEGSHFSDGTHSCFTSIRWRRPGSSSDSVAERWRVSVGPIDSDERRDKPGSDAMDDVRERRESEPRKDERRDMGGVLFIVSSSSRSAARRSSRDIFQRRRAGSAAI